MSGLMGHEDGQAVVEYAVLVTLILFVAIAVITALGLDTAGLYGDVVSKIP